MRICRYITIALCLVTAVLRGHAQGNKLISIVAYAEPATVKLNQAFKLVYVIYGTNTIDTALLNVTNVELLNGPYTYPAPIEKNSQATLVDTLVYEVQPLFAGFITLPRATIVIDGEEYKTPQINVTVQSNYLPNSDGQKKSISDDPFGNLFNYFEVDTAMAATDTTIEMEFAFTDPQGIYEVHKKKPFVVPYTVVIKNAKDASLLREVEIASFPQGENVQVKGSNGTTTNMTWLNGELTLSKSFNLIMVASTKGQKKLSPALITVGEKRISSPAATIKVK